MSCCIGPNTELEQGAIGGQPPRSFEEANLSFEEGKHRCIILLYVSPIIFTLCLDCAFTYRSQMLTSCIRAFTLQENLVYPYDGLEW
jgi:hypothetical protein